VVLTPPGGDLPSRRDLLGDCVHCGFCLPACPTYQLDGQEMESPRGRIHLMDLVERGEIAPDGTYAAHIDSCLGCLACVPACPSGVRYDLLLPRARAELEARAPRRPADRLFRASLFRVFPYPARLRLAVVAGLLYRRLGLRALAGRLGIRSRLPARVRALEELLPPVRLRSLFTRMRRVTPAAGSRRRRVALLRGCAQRVLFSEVNAATVRVLAAEGCEVLVPRGQGCCGALSLHAGREAEAAALARRTIDAFEGTRADVVVVNVAGCGSAMKDYGDLLAGDPAYGGRAAGFATRVRDVHELLAELPPVAPRHRVDAAVAYHDACHLANAQGVRRAPRDVLRTVPGLRLVELPEADMCCGSAGVYNLVRPESGERLGRRRAAHVRATTPDIVVTGNAGCLLQLRRFLGEEVPLAHPVEVLDASIRGGGLGPGGTPGVRTGGRRAAAARGRAGGPLGA
jgi:glycolate oxidase iron-sulfur subunit